MVEFVAGGIYGCVLCMVDHVVWELYGCLLCMVDSMVWVIYGCVMCMVESRAWVIYIMFKNSPKQKSYLQVFQKIFGWSKSP